MAADVLRERLRRLQAHTGVPTLVLAASNIDAGLAPALDDALARIGPTPRLDVVAWLRGGEVEAAHRLALRLHAATARLRFVVPHACASSGTLMALAAGEIVAGPLALFSPIDPHLAGGGGAGVPEVLSSEDLRRLPEALQALSGLPRDAASAQALALLARRIAPATLATFHGAASAMAAKADALLALHEPAAARRDAIVRALLQAHGSHDHAITGDELRALGLPVVRDAAIEALAWDVACAVRATIGPESRASLADDWHDAAVGDADALALRLRTRGRRAGAWRTDARSAQARETPDAAVNPPRDGR